MSDPLKNKFKYFTFKLYDKELRHDQTYFDEQYKKLAEHPDITLIDSYLDYCCHVGIHRNGVFRSTSYKNISKMFTQKTTKINGVYLHFGDLPTYKDYNKWLQYCFFRQETNFKRYLPKEVRTGALHECETPLSSPRPSVSCRSNNDYDSNIQITF